MNDTIYPLLYQQMDTAVMEAETGGALRLLTDPPCWLHQFFADVRKPDQQMPIKERFPFLDNFLVDANDFCHVVNSD